MRGYTLVLHLQVLLVLPVHSCWLFFPLSLSPLSNSNFQFLAQLYISRFLPPLYLLVYHPFLHPILSNPVSLPSTYLPTYLLSYISLLQSLSRV